MNNFYPKGAIKGKEQFEEILKSLNKPGALYLVSFVGARIDATVFKVALGDDAKLTSTYRDGAKWRIQNSNPLRALSFEVDPVTDYIGSSSSNGYVFNNFWYAYAYVKHLEQSNIRVDWSFDINVG